MKINIQDFMSITPEELSKKQHDILKEAILKRIYLVAELISKEQYDKVYDLMGFSPSGDCHGCDNHYISFEDVMEDEGDGVDISTVLNRLDELKKIYSKRDKND